MSTTISALHIPTGTWVLDPAHTRLGFEVKHLGISTVRGHFRELEGRISSADGLLVAQGSAAAASIDTGNDDRDAHLRSGDFFAADEHPRLHFRATELRDTDQGSVVAGQLTIRGVPRPVELVVEDVATGEDDEGREKLALTATGRIRRGDFGLTWNSVVGKGKLLVGESVRLVLDVAAFREDG